MDFQVADIGKNARGPRCECTQCASSEGMKAKYARVTFSGYDDIKPKETAELLDHQYLLLTSHMFGFILKDRSYGEYIRGEYGSWAGRLSC